RWSRSPLLPAGGDGLPAGAVAGRGELVAVVAQHELLQRRRVADQAADLEPAQDADRGVEVVAVDREPHPVAGGLQVVDAGRALQAGDRAPGPGLDGGAGEVPHLGERPRLHDLALPDDADLV